MNMEKTETISISIIEGEDLNDTIQPWILQVLNQPECDGYIGLRTAASNNLADHLSNTAAWHQAKLEGGRVEDSQN